MEKLLERWNREGKMDDDEPRAKLMRRLKEINDPANHLDEGDRRALREQLLKDFQVSVAARAAAHRNDDVPPVEEDFELTYHNEEEKLLGCSHYPRNCKLKCPSCGRFSTCRVCHEKKFKHQLDRFKVDTMYCMLCHKEGPVGHRCSFCDEEMSVYYCGVCHIFTDPGDKIVFHCDKCGLCRVQNRGEAYKHCDTCDACMAIDHVCLATTRDRQCPVCRGDLFTSRKDILTPFRCSHMLHKKCLLNLCRSTSQIPICPVCRKSLVDDGVLDEITLQFEYQMARWTVPAELGKYRVSFSCNDCELKFENVPWNFAYKCPKCNHFNTSVVDGGGVVEEDEDEKEGDHATVQTVASMEEGARVDDACAELGGSSLDSNPSRGTRGTRGLNDLEGLFTEVAPDGAAPEGGRDDASS